MAPSSRPANNTSLSASQLHSTSSTSQPGPGSGSAPARSRPGQSEPGTDAPGRRRSSSPLEIVEPQAKKARMDANAVAGPSSGVSSSSSGRKKATPRESSGVSVPEQATASAKGKGKAPSTDKASSTKSKRWHGPIGSAYLATLLGPDQVWADGKRYLTQGLYYLPPAADPAASTPSAPRPSTPLLPLPNGSAIRAILEQKRDFSLPFNIAKDTTALLAKTKHWPRFLATLPLSRSAHTSTTLTPAQRGQAAPAPKPPRTLKEMQKPDFIARYTEPDPSRGADGKRFAVHGLYWKDDGRGSAEQRKANAWKKKFGVDGLTLEPLLPIPHGLGQYVLSEKRDFGLPFDIMSDVHRLSKGKYQPPVPRRAPPAPAPEPSSQPLAKSTSKQQPKSTPLARSSSRRSRASNADLQQPAAAVRGEKRFLTHGLYWTEDPRVRPAQREANIYKRDLSGLSGDELDAQRLLPLPTGEGFLLLTEERDFSLPFDILPDSGEQGEGQDKSAVVTPALGPEVEMQVEVELEEVGQPAPVVKEVVRKPPPYKLINKNIYVGRGKDAEEHPAVCECKRPADPNEPGCQEDCLNRAMQISCNTKTCPCGEQCSNLPFGQLKGVDKKDLSVFWTGNRGWGLKTLVDIKKGDFIIEYTGEIISRAESYRRVLNEYKDWHAYYFLNYDGYEVIDAGLKGNCARFINHSCGPNVQVVSCKYADIDEFQIGIVATEDIKAGTELGYDYGWQNFADLRAQADAAERAASDASSNSSTHEASASVAVSASAAAEAIGELGRQRCFCGAAVCSGWLGKKVDKNRSGQVVPTQQPAPPAKKSRAKRAAESAGLSRSRSSGAVAGAVEVVQAGVVAIKKEELSPVGKLPQSGSLITQPMSLRAFVAEAEAAADLPEHHFALDPVVRRPCDEQWVVFASDLRPGDVDAVVYAEAKRTAARDARRAAKAAAVAAQAGLLPVKTVEVVQGALPSPTVTEVSVGDMVEEEGMAAVVVKKVARVHAKRPRRV